MYRLVDRFDARRLQEICDVLDLLLALSRTFYPRRLQFQGEHGVRGGYENNESDNIAPARKRAEFMVICGPTRQRTQMKLHRIVQPRRRPSVFRSQVLHDPMQPIGPGSAEFTYIDAFRAVSEVAREHQCRSAVHGDL